MVHTPFPYSNDDYENPSILVSNDSVTWETPVGLLNPIEPTPEDDTRWNADGDLVMTPEGEMWCIWREGNLTAGLSMNARHSSDGVTWSERQTLWTDADFNHDVSPAIIRRDDVYMMWSVDASVTPRQVWRRIGNAPDNWQAPLVCNLTMPGDGTWHINVTWHDGIYYIVTNWDIGNGDLWLAMSTDGLNWTSATEPLVVKNNPGWDERGVYRACLLHTDSGWELWYAGRNTPEDEWHIGHTTVTGL